MIRDQHAGEGSHNPHRERDLKRPAQALRQAQGAGARGHQHRKGHERAHRANRDRHRQAQSAVKNHVPHAHLDAQRPSHIRIIGGDQKFLGRDVLQEKDEPEHDRHAPQHGGFHRQDISKEDVQDVRFAARGFDDQEHRGGRPARIEHARPAFRAAAGSCRPGAKAPGK